MIFVQNTLIFPKISHRNTLFVRISWNLMDYLNFYDLSHFLGIFIKKMPRNAEKQPITLNKSSDFSETVDRKFVKFSGNV